MKTKRNRSMKQKKSSKQRGRRPSTRWRAFLERLRVETLIFSQRIIDYFDADNRGALYYVVLAIPFLLRAIARRKPQRRRRISKRVAKQPVRSLARRKFGAKRSGRRVRRH